MSKIDEILKKSLQGRLATDPKLSAEEETLTSNALVDYGPYSSEAEARTLPPLRDARFVPSTPYDYALRSQTATATVPRRFRRWSEAALIFGADLFSEGFDFDLITSATFDSTENLNPNSHFSESPNFSVITDTFLALHDADNAIINNTAKSNLRIASVSAAAGTQLDVTTSIFNTSDGGATYRWSHYGYKPVQLLPLPSSEGPDQVTAFAAILPEDWPVFSWTKEYFDLTFGFALTKNDVTSVDVSGIYNGERLQLEIDTGDLAVNDYVLIQNQIFVVDSLVTIGGGRDNAFVTPFHTFEADVITESLGTTIQTLYTVGELIANPGQSVGTDANGNTIPPLYNSPVLDWIRVRRLYPPSATNSNRSLIGAFIDITKLDQVGFAPALIPTDAVGDPLPPTSGVTDFGQLTIDPAVSGEDQEVIVDYREGIFHLSHAIADGGDLNPNTFTDPNGYPRLYALFAAWNGPYHPLKATELDRISSRAGLGRVPTDSVERSPVSGKAGWKLTLGDEENGKGDYYFYAINESVDSPKGSFGGLAESLYFIESNLSHEGGPLVVMQKRSDLNTYIQVGALAFGGRGGSGSSDVSQIRLIPEIGDNTNNITSVNKPDISFGTMKSLFSADPSFYRTISPGDTLQGTLNGYSFNIALIDDTSDGADDATPPTGIQVTDGQRSLPEIIEDIDAKLPGALTRGSDYELFYYNDGTDYVLVFEASQSLEITTDDAGLFSIPTATSDDIIVGFGYNKALVNTLRWVRAQNELWFDGEGVKVRGVKLGTPLSANYVLEGFDLKEQSVEGGTIFVSVGPGKVMTSEGTISIEDESRVSLTDAKRHGIYVDSATGQVTSTEQATTSDYPFDLGVSVTDIPLYIVQTDSGEPDGTSYIFDARDLMRNQEIHLPLTVSQSVASGARFAGPDALLAAIEQAKKIEDAFGGRCVIDLMSNVTLDLGKNTDDYSGVVGSVYNGAPIALPENLKIQGNGYTVTVSGIPNQVAGFGDPVFRPNRTGSGTSNLEMENITWTLDAGETNDASLLAGNYQNAGQYILRNVKVLFGAGADFDLMAASNANNAVIDYLAAYDCQFEGQIRFRKINTLKLERVDIPSPTPLVGDINQSLNIEGLFNFVSGSTLTLNLESNVDARIRNVRCSNITIASVDTTDTDIRLFMSDIACRESLTIGNSGRDMGAIVLMDNINIESNVSAGPNLEFYQVERAEVRGLSINTFADRSVLIDDSDVTLQDFVVLNNSSSTGSSKVGIDIQGSAGALEGATNLMQCRVNIQNGLLDVDEGWAVYVSKGSESQIIIQGCTFKNLTASANARGVVLNSSGSAVEGLNARNVIIAHNNFDFYDSTGTDTYAIAANAAVAANQSEIFIHFNLIRGDSGASTFYNVTSNNANNSFTV